jgi:hypothetical protein
LKALPQRHHRYSCTTLVLRSPTLALLPLPASNRRGIRGSGPHPHKSL